MDDRGFAVRQVAKLDQRSWIEVNLGVYKSNVENLKKTLLPQQSFLQVVKADAYGHGAYQIAVTALEAGAIMLGVANVDEAIHLRIHKISAPILILSPSLPHEVDSIIRYDIIPSVSEIKFCELIDKVAKLQNKKVPIHIKIDTGMNRNGIKKGNFAGFLDKFSNFSHIYIQGVFSHFAASDDDMAFTTAQYEDFRECIELLRGTQYHQINKSLRYIHIENSCALFRQDNMQPNISNLVRFGIMSFGHFLDEKLKSSISLSPIMSFKSLISHLNTAKKGETIGYNRTYTVEAEQLLYATVPVGYADGYDFLLSGKAMVVVHPQGNMNTDDVPDTVKNGILCPVLGKISMDMLCVDVSGVPGVALYDQVELLGVTHEAINASTLVKHYTGSVYELLCQLGRRAKRFYIIGDNIVADEPLTRRAFISQDYAPHKLNDIILQAISERTKNDEVSTAIYRDILREIFLDADSEISYRTDFDYKISFSECDKDDFYKVQIELSFTKLLQHDDFIVVCANDLTKLPHFFSDKKCEYRWLLDKSMSISTDWFFIKRATLDGCTLDPTSYQENDCILYRFSDPIIRQSKGKAVKYLIEAETYYSKKSHSLSVYLNEITTGVRVSFSYPKSFFATDSTVIFSGRERFPEIVETLSGDVITITIQTQKDTWVFPSSAIVFSFSASSHKNVSDKAVEEKKVT
jgi:alanine racemase